ncbi:hypothetical protein [Heyndrickxia acidicola]|uniref:Uncharacterized protein n=1 Tax=Heyndrickxia acidicola TaxID=209389 RepID=A0ABU6MI70_9BACI|nr:hypothetical protein [Heyndrickxia acidicola]MED1203706.1 hypothetical protein [Heyndrickxia acidicola]
MKFFSGLAIFLSIIAFSMCALVGWTLTYGLPDFLDNAINQKNSNGTAQVVEAASLSSYLSQEIKKLSTSQIEYLSLHDPEYTPKTFIKVLNEDFNQIVAWGQVNEMDWRQADMDSRLVAVYTNYFLQNNKLKGKALNDDFTKLNQYALSVIQTKDKNAIIMEHRFLHDLDKALNHNTSTDTYGVTETYGKGK